MFVGQVKSCVVIGRLLLQFIFKNRDFEIALLIHLKEPCGSGRLGFSYFTILRVYATDFFIKI